MFEKYLVIYPSGSLAWKDLERAPRYNCVYNGEAALDLKDIYQIIGCDCLEQVHTVIPGVVILVDESGRIKTPSQQHNEVASRLYFGWLYGTDDIVGPAVVCSLRPSGPLHELDWFPLDQRQLAYLRLCLGVEIPDPEL